MSTLYKHNKSRFYKVIPILFIVICFIALIWMPTDIYRPAYEYASTTRYTIYNYNDTAYGSYDLKEVNLHFLHQFKNPCWVERYTGNYSVYARNSFMIHRDYASRWKFPNHLEKTSPFGVSVQLDTGECANKLCRLRCLPYFMLLGVQKSGTTDINQRIMLHPQIFQGCRKEIFWWSEYRHSVNTTLGDYSDLFDNNLKRLLQHPSTDAGKVGNPSGMIEGHRYNNILGDYTADTFYDFGDWRKDPDNTNLSEPKVTLPHYIRIVLPKVKLIVILRNPTTRLYSDYNFFNSNGTPEKFHEKVLGSIYWWQTCLEKLPERNCAYGSPPEMPPVFDGTDNRKEIWPKNRNYTGEIRNGMYGLMIKDWLSVFSRENMLFLKTEEYSSNLKKAYNEQIFPFLGVDKLPEGSSTLSKIIYKTPAFKGTYEPMLEKTKVILDLFYIDFNKELASTLDDDKWLWND